MVRTYWLVPVFNEASGNLDLQPDRTDDQIEAESPPCYVCPRFYPRRCLR
jgi:hypothetical protein